MVLSGGNSMSMAVRKLIPVPALLQTPTHMPVKLPFKTRSMIKTGFRHHPNLSHVAQVNTCQTSETPDIKKNTSLQEFTSFCQNQEKVMKHRKTDTRVST